MTTTRYYKVWFTNGTEFSSQRVIDTDTLAFDNTRVSDYAKLFPQHEISELKELCRTELFDSFSEACAGRRFSASFELSR